MEKNEVKRFTFCLVGAIFVCHSVGLVQETEQYPSNNVNASLSTKHYRVRIARTKSDEPDADDYRPEPNLESWVKVKDTDLLTTNGGINNSEVKSIQTDDNKRSKRSPGKAMFDCIDLQYKYVPTIDATSVGPCIDHCWVIRRELALLKQDKCSCIHDDNFVEKFSVVNISKCTAKCKNEDKQSCGGENVYSSYETGYKDEPRFNEKSVVEVRNLFMGCYKMKKEFKPEIKLTTFRLHPRMCLEYCVLKQAEYAGLNNGNVCQCLGKVGGYFVHDRSLQCRVMCAGSRDWWCGGDVKDVYVLYRTGYSMMNKKTTDKRFEDMSWAQSARKSAKEYDYFIDEKEETKTGDENKNNNLNKTIKAPVNMVKDDVRTNNSTKKIKAPVNMVKDNVSTNNSTKKIKAPVNTVKNKRKKRRRRRRKNCRKRHRKKKRLT